MKPLLLSLLLGLILAVPFAYSADPAAPSTTSLNITPALSEIPLTPEKESTTEITVSNPSHYQLSIETTVSDVKPGERPGTTTIDEHSNVSSIPWFTISPDTFVLEPRSSRIVTVHITAPSTAPVGGHYAAVFFKSSLTKASTPSNNAIAISSRVGSLFFMTVSGELTTKADISEFQISKFSHKRPVNFTLGISNEGNVHLKPKGDITITGFRGRTVGALPITENTSFLTLPGSTRTEHFTWSPPHAFGIYTARAVVEIAPGVSISSQHRFVVLPPLFIMFTGFFSVVGLLALGFSLMRARRSRKPLST
jgi:hypothetical protein